MIVEVLKIPVRYQGVTYPSGQVFDMEEDHFNENIVREATEEEEAEMGMYSKGADRTRNPEVTEPKVEVEKQETPAVVPTEYTDLTEAELKKVKNDDLKAYLDSKNIEYKPDAIKEDYINAILGK